LADEINRAPPKTQAALLEAMQEHSVTVSGKTYQLEEPFFVLATQNPIEQEGTYPLPEAQLDRFMFNLELDYPSFDEEIQVLKTTTGGDQDEIRPMVTGQEIIQFQKVIRKVPVPDEVLQYVVHLIQATRPSSNLSTSEIKKFVRYGAGPRASQQIIFSAKVRAVFEGRFHVEIEDIKSLAFPILRHRILLNYHAEAERVTIRDVINQLTSQVH
jgi:MoxR-like ATPase